MERLTKEISVGHYRSVNDGHNTRAVNKCGRLEDIEEELGIDLITLFKAIMSKDGLKWENKYGFVSTLDKEEIEEIKNALTKEELEK